jgi:outer membrane protein OmpA-like peptidoglycan-associated protein
VIPEGLSSIIWLWASVRANSVKNYLGSLGVAKESLSTISYGEEKPLVS